MTPEFVYHKILAPASDLIAELGGPRRSRRADTLLLAICGQESGWRNRVQIGGGPARGLWQFEKSGVQGVLTHSATLCLACALCSAHDIAHPLVTGVYRTLPVNDQLAAGFARLLVFTDPHELPKGEAAAWDCYLRLWRPGKPRPEAWEDNYRRAASYLSEST